MLLFKCINLAAIIGLVLIGSVCIVNSSDLDYTDITVVTDETRYQVLNPDIVLDAFNKIRHVKGNIYFSKGKRITGDRLVLNFLDEESFTKSEDIQVRIRYPAEGKGLTITFIEVLVDLTSENADTFVFEGGIGEKYAALLLECNKTSSFTYEIFIYGY